MSRLIFFAALGLLAYLLIKRLRAPQDPAPKRNQSPRKPAGEAMIACVYCGLNIPLSESVKNHDGRYYCSEEHSRLAAK